MKYILSMGIFLLGVLAIRVEGGEVSRSLDYIASLLRMTQNNLHGQDNHITVLALEGDLDKALLIKSFQVLFQAHPNLRTKNIRYDQSRGRFFTEGELGFEDIPCQFLNVSKENKWRELLSTLVSTPFSSEGPYWKIYCLSVENSNPTRHFLIQCFDHSLSDGISTAKLQDELLTYYQQFRQDRDLQMVVDVPVSSPALLFPKDQQCDWEAFKQRQDRLNELFPPLPQGAPFEVVIPLDSRCSQAVLFAFEVEDLRTVCKEHHRTVNDALVAAGLLALRDSHPTGELDTSVLTCVNLRNPKIGLADQLHSNQLASLFNIVVHPQKIQKNENLWVTAQNYRETFTIFMEQVGRPPTDFIIDEMYERCGIRTAQERDCFSGGIATSNLGNVDIKKTYGELNVLFYQFFTNQGGGFFETLLDFVCIENTLYCNVTYVKPLRSRAWALQFASDFIKHLSIHLPKQLILIDGATDQDFLERFSAMK